MELKISGLDYANPDYEREKRRGFPEAVYAAGKTPEQIAGIAKAMINSGQSLVLITRLSSDSAETLKTSLPELAYFKEARLGVLGEFPEVTKSGKIVIATGGTSDIPVAEEAALTARSMGNEVVKLYDVGIAGLHRLMSKIDVLREARVIISVAGMEGALTSVIAGLVSCPVIGVPTSAGYGSGAGGFAALLSMLNSCAGGVGVVNIDNGYGAALLASMINS